MALTLSKTGIVDGQVINAAQISQSIDALTAAEAYDISISGSFTLVGNMTGSGIFANAAVANSIRPRNIAANKEYTLPYLAATSSVSEIYYSALGPTYNPVTDTLKAGNFQGTASFVVSSSYATTASYAANANNSVFTYVGIDDVTYTSSLAGYPVNANTPSQIYVSQSNFRLALQFAAGNDGQIINFTPYYEAANLLLSNIDITSSVTVNGLDGRQVTPGPGGSRTANNLFNPGVNNVGNLTFQYISTPSGFLTSGWYLINKNAS
jgi:hypothetical protein